VATRRSAACSLTRSSAARLIVEVSTN
jgi:hypothetical protein